MHARDKSGKEYFIEVKARSIHRIDVGRIVEQAAAVLKERPDANILLLCSSIDPDVRNMLAKAGSKTFVFGDLEFERPGKRTPRQQIRLDMSPSEQQAYFALIRKEKKVILTRDLALLIGISIPRARNFLAALNRRGVIFRLGRGKYAVLPPDVLYERKTYTADPYAVIDMLMKGYEYYVAYASAAHMHGIVTQPPFVVYVATLKQKRPINLGKTRIQFVTINKSRFFSIEERDYFGSTLRVSDLEKTVIDCFDRSDLVVGMDEVARIAAEAITRMNWNKLLDYARKMDREVLIQRLGFVLEKLSGAGYKVSEAILDRLEGMLDGKFTHPLDTRVRKRGKLSKRWGIYENLNCLWW